MLTRFDQPVADVFNLRHLGQSMATKVRLSKVYLLMHLSMHRHGKMFWDWSPDEWLDTLCKDSVQFQEKHGTHKADRMTIMDAAYLLGGVTDLRAAGIRREVTETAAVYFGHELMMEQCKKVFDVLKGKGYGDKEQSLQHVEFGLSMLFVLQRSPYLENISEALIAEVSLEGRMMRHAMVRITKSLQHLGILSSRKKDENAVSHHADYHSDGMAREWYGWCIAWYERAVDLTPRVRNRYVGHLLSIGRWLYEKAPEVRTPAQWTEDLALQFRSDLCLWTAGRYSESHGRRMLESSGRLGRPLQPRAIFQYLITIRRFLTDVTRRPHAVNGEPARKISLEFIPKEVLTIPDYIQQAMDEANPRDVDLRVWAKLTIAAATLSQDDLSQATRYPLSFYRALGLLWVTSARRPNEIVRLRLDCLHEEWDPEMLDENDEPVIRIDAGDRQVQSESEKGVSKIYYLLIPTGKKRGSFWIWIPDYVAYEIKAWKRDRGPQQKRFLDWKTNEEVELLFCDRDKKVGEQFLNGSLIPLLCTKAGVDMEDAIGRITGHRGRSTRLTLLRNNGVSLEDLAEYAGHSDTSTIRHYARLHPIQLHRRIRKADDTSRIIEGVVDLQAAAKGQPALRWFIGYDADGEPMFCGNQHFITCAHRLDCERCGMFIGGEKAKLLEEGKNTLSIEAKVPMTPIEKCVVDGDQEGAEACRAALRMIPAPEAPDISLIFNPEGLSNHELEKLAQLATADALDKLREALDAHQKKLAEVQKNKTGRNALVGGQKKRISLIQKLIADCEQAIGERQSGHA